MSKFNQCMSGRLTMEAIRDFLLGYLLSWGTPALGLALIAAAAGVPLPVSILLIAAGAFARQGLLNAPLAAGVGVAGAVLGDTLSFALGRFAQGWVAQRYGGWAIWQRTQAMFGRLGGLTVFVTRFSLTSLALPANLIAGGSGYRFARFFLYDVAGEVLWVALYGGAGYLFGEQWETVSLLLSNSGNWLFGLVLGLGVGYAVVKMALPFWKKYNRLVWKKYSYRLLSR